MFRNQYCVSVGSWPGRDEGGFHGFHHRTWGRYHLCAHPALPVSEGAHEDRRLLMLGFAIDPHHPAADNDDITRDLVRAADTMECLLECIRPLAGRFVLLVDDGERARCVSDACGLRRVFYTPDPDSLVLTSSIKVYLEFIGRPLVTPPEVRAFMASADYSATEAAWIGDGSPDQRLRRLLPNHVLDLTSGQATRMRFSVPADQREDEVIGVCSALLRGTYEGLMRRYRPIQPLTAGWDSRLLLAGSRSHTKSVSYYVFDRSRGGVAHRRRM